MSFASANVFGQNSLEGHIYDESTGEPLIGATVYFPDLKLGGATDVEGYFRVEHLPEGTFLLQVEYIGYSRIIRSVDVSGMSIYSFNLTPSITELREIIVTGISSAAEAAREPMAHTFTSKEDMLQRSSTNIVDAISKQPGISQITTGPAISKPVVRGLSSNRVLTLNNGQPQEGQQWGDEHGIEIDDASIERVEIIKGPGSLMFGSDALAGVINFLPPKPVPQGVINGKISAIYQSNNKMYGLHFFNAGNVNGKSWQFNINRKQAANYQNQYDGRVYNSGFNELNYNGYFGINRKWGYSHFHFSRFGQELGLVEGERDTEGRFVKEIIVNGNESTVVVSEDKLNSYGINVPRQEIEHIAFSTDNNFILKKSRVTINVGYQKNVRKEFEDPEGGGPDLLFKLQTVNYDVKYYPRIKSKWETTLGINGKTQVNANEGEEFLIPDYNLVDVGIFVITKKSFGKLNFSGGLRYDFRDLDSKALYLDVNDVPVQESNSIYTKFNAIQRQFFSISGSVGFTYEASENTLLKLNFSRGYRAPNIAELGSNGVHEGAFRYEYGNPDLDPETSFQTDLGINFDGEHTTLSIGAFYNHIDRYIFISKLQNSIGGDSIPDPADPVPAYQFTQTKANLYGGEISIDIHPHPIHWLHFENSLSMVFSRQNNTVDSTKYLPLTPAHIFRSELKGNFKNEGHGLQNMFLTLGASYTFAQNRVFSAYGTETPTDAYWLLRMATGTDIITKDGKNILTIVLIAENLLDTGYQNHLSRLKYAPENPATGRGGIFNMGRNFSVKVIVPYSLKK